MMKRVVISFSTILYVICGTKDRYARSKYAKICTIEQAKKIREGYRRRRKKELNFSLLNRQVHVICYKSLVYDLKKVSTITKKEKPRLMKNYSQSSNISPVLTDITNNQSTTTTYDPYFFSTTTNSNALLLFRNRKRDLNTTTSISSFLNCKKENSKPVKQRLNTNRVLFDLSDDDVSLIKLDESHSTEVPNVYFIN